MTLNFGDQSCLHPTTNVCEGFSIDAPPALLTRTFGVSVPSLPGEIVKPGQPAMIIRTGNNSQGVASVMTWGICPPPAADASPAGRVCTVHTEDDPLYWQLIASQRCVIPATGYLLRSTASPGKPCHHVSMKDASLFAFAGLWSSWHNSGGARLESFSILTTVANILLSPFHAAMPVILHYSESAYWLMHGMQGIECFFMPYPSDLMQISRLHHSDPVAGSAAVRQ